MKKDKENYFIIKLDIYPFDVMISIDESDKILRKRLGGLGIDVGNNPEEFELSETIWGRAIIFETNETLIRFKQKEDNSEMVGIIVHEVFHIVTFIMDRVGMRFELEVSDEAYAYLIQYLTTQILKNWNKDNR